MEAAFNNPLMYWTGMNTLDLAASELEEFNNFYSGTHSVEVVASDPGFVQAHRYELLVQDPRGPFGPRWLTVYEISNERSAQSFIERKDGPKEARPKYSSGPPVWENKRTSPWKMIWRRLDQAGESPGAPDAIHIVGLSPPADASSEELQEFNDFYTNVHVPEIMAHRHCSRAIRYELMREFVHPSPGCPTVCAIYEADEETMVAIEMDLANRTDWAPPSSRSSGPQVWKNRRTAWSLYYQRIKD